MRKGCTETDAFPVEGEREKGGREERMKERMDGDRNAASVQAEGR